METELIKNLEKEMIIFDGATHWDEEQRNQRIAEHLLNAYKAGINF